MAAGDAQRVWFPEMIERLRSQWHQDMSLDAIVELRDELDAMLQRIRSERRIRSASFSSVLGAGTLARARTRMSVFAR